MMERHIRPNGTEAETCMFCIRCPDTSMGDTAMEAVNPGSTLTGGAASLRGRKLTLSCVLSWWFVGLRSAGG